MNDNNLPPAIPRVAASALLRANPIIAVLRATDARLYDPVVEVLATHGIRSIEFTLSTPGTFEHLEQLRAQVGDDVEIGIGTITSTAEARRAIDAGADFLVTPIASPEVVALAVGAGKPVFPGGFTPTELFGSWASGATAVKIFPAETVGPRFAQHLRGPFPDIEFVPSGGIDLADIPAWLKAGALAVSVGGPLIGDALAGGSLVALADRARKANELVRETVGAR